MAILSSYPILLCVLVFFAGLAIIIIGSSKKCPRDKESEKYINSVNNINQLINNEPHITNETELVHALSKYNIRYSPLQKKETL